MAHPQVNNASFCVLLGASQEIAKEFAQGQFQPLIVNISTAGSVVGVSNVMVGRMGDWGRIGFVATGNMVGYVLVGLAYSVAPWDRDPVPWHFPPAPGRTFPCKQTYPCLLVTFALAHQHRSHRLSLPHAPCVRFASHPSSQLLVCHYLN